MHYRKPNGVWATVGWFNLRAGQDASGVFHEAEHLATDTDEVFVYAEAADGTQLIHGDEQQRVNGKSVLMKRVQLRKYRDDSYMLRVGC
jgi:hypothetical protein